MHEDPLGEYVLDERPSFCPHLLRSEEHTSELQSQSNLVCRLLLEKKKHNDSLYPCRQAFLHIPHFLFRAGRDRDFARNLLPAFFQVDINLLQSITTLILN